MKRKDNDLYFYKIPHGLIIYCKESRVKALYNALTSSLVKFDEIVPSYDSIGILNRGEKFGRLKSIIESILSQTNEASLPKDAILHKIPILYENENSDLEYLSEELGLSEPEIIDIHSTTIYEVAMIGFLPGFVYLSGLDSRIHHARKHTPRKHVSAGSVGIAGHQTGIYPCNSPGDWQILGTTPVKMFDPNSATIVPFEIGSKVKFEVITQEEYGKLKKND